MVNLNIGKIISNKRKEKGVTQDEVAVYIGVSKASVSKWENNQSYPDITLLPELATYFNMTIDELIGYEKQMTKEDIKKTYKVFAKRFASENFDDVYSDILAIVKKYYSCFPLLMQMVVLILNHLNTASIQKKKEASDEIISLCIRIREESNDVNLSKQADIIKAAIYMQLGKPALILEILGEKCDIRYSEAQIISSAYQMLGKINNADVVLQADMFQSLIILISEMQQFIMLHISDLDKISKTAERGIAISKAFNLEKLHPNSIAGFYISASTAFAINKKYEEALKFLRMYVNIAHNFLKISLHGDDYFDDIDSWIEDFPLGDMVPTSEKTIKNNLITSVLNNKAFEEIKQNQDFKEIIKELKMNLGDGLDE